MARLRDYFGDVLLVQVGRRMELTPLAQTLIAPVRDVFLRARVAISIRPTFNPAEISTSFSIAASDYMVELLLAKVVCELAGSTPGLRLDIASVPDMCLRSSSEARSIC